MTQLDEKTRQIGTQVAAKIAADLVVQSYRHDDQPSLDGMIGDFVNTLDLINTTLLSKMGEDSLAAIFPDSTFMPDNEYQDNIVPFIPRTPPQAAPIPGVEDGDPKTAALWRRYFNDPKAFWDNRRDKKNPKSPDFKLKDDGDQALWISDPYHKNPSWVATRLDSF